MKGLKVAAFLILAAACSCARGDTIISGSAYNQDLIGNVSGASGASSSSLSLVGGSLLPYQGYASLTANVGDMSGTVSALGDSWEIQSWPWGVTTVGRVGYNLTVDGTYELTGGTGYGYADLIVNPFSWVNPGGSLTCTLTFAGQTHDCEYGAVAPFYVPYNTPLNLDFNVNYQGTAFDASGFNDTLSYNFTDVTNVTPMPEPSSLLLLGTGLIALVGTVRRRV